MKKAIWFGTALLVAAIAACGGDDETGATQDVSDVLALTGDIDDGEIVFSGNCTDSNCHGTDGNSGDGTDMSQGVPGKSKEQLATTIRYGTGDMAGLGHLSAQQIADVIAYVQDHFGP